MKAKIEIMNKLLWITTLPNTSVRSLSLSVSAAAEKIQFEIADANYLILTLFADTMSDAKRWSDWSSPSLPLTDWTLKGMRVCK